VTHVVRVSRPGYRESAWQSSLVWVTYGVVEGSLLVFGPLVRRTLEGLRLDLVPHGVPPFVSASFTAFVLLVYLLTGVVLGVAAAAVSGMPPLRSRLPTGTDAAFWSSLSSLALCLAVAGHMSAAKEYAVLAAVPAPALLSAARLASVWNPAGWRGFLGSLAHPMVVAVLLVGGADLAQPRWYVPPVLRLCLLFTFATLVPALASLFRRWPGSRPRAALALPVASCLVVVATALTGGTSRMDVQAPPGAPPAAKVPNVLLITLDTVRADHVSVYGYRRDTTPNLRRLATTCATVYSRAIASSNWTLPSHASLFTGQTPRRHGAVSTARLFPIASTSSTLAELLAARGYRTAGIAANWALLAPAFGFGRGFSSYECLELEDFWTLSGKAYLLRERVRALTARLASPFHRHRQFAPADEVNARAIPFLGAASRDRRPFFLFLNYMDAHAPYLPPAPFDSRFGRPERALDWPEYQRVRDAVTHGHERRLTAREAADLTDQYDGAITYLDDRIEVLLRTLKSLGLFDDTLIVITSDHGEAFGESSVVGHGVSLFQHQVHVPLIVKYPHSTTAAESDVLASSIDILPTVLDTIGADVPPAVHGVSLRLLPARGGRWIASESDRPRGDATARGDAGPAEVAIFWDHLKRITGVGGVDELFDLSSDPGERAAATASGPDAAAWQARLSAYLADESGPVPVARPAVDPATLERLKALGYIH
jgi:arylsulfatase A-like enzyme